MDAAIAVPAIILCQAMMSDVRRCWSASSFGGWRWVERRCLVCRSDIGRTRRTAQSPRGDGRDSKSQLDASCRIARSAKLRTGLFSARSATGFVSSAFSRSRSLTRRACHAAIFLAPPIQRLFRDADMTACVDRCRAPANKHIHLTQLRDDLLRRKPPTFHSFLRFSRPAGASLLRIGPVVPRQTNPAKRFYRCAAAQRRGHLRWWSGLAASRISSRAHARRAAVGNDRG
jgi:hypothetical protein